MGFQKISFFLIFSLFSPCSFAWTLVSNSILRWENPKLTIYAATTNCGVDEANLFSIMQQAVRSWNRPSSSALVLSLTRSTETVNAENFQNRSLSQVPVIFCDPNFGTSFSGVNVDGVPGLAPSPTRANGFIVYGGVILNAQSNAGARIAVLSEEEILVTIAHEIGHLLGLGHSSLETALMYYSIARKTKSTLHQDDIDGLSFLYPRNEFVAGMFGCSNVSQKNPPLSLFTTLFGWILNTGIFLCLWIFLQKMMKYSGQCKSTSSECV